MINESPPMKIPPTNITTNAESNGDFKFLPTFAFSAKAGGIMIPAKSTYKNGIKF